jgi:hypothetical protein
MLKQKIFYKQVFERKFANLGRNHISFSGEKLLDILMWLLRYQALEYWLSCTQMFLIKNSEHEKSWRITSKPVFEFPGGRRFHFCDPNGNELAVWSE